MPSQLSTSKIFFLISAIINLAYALILSAYAAITGLFTCGIGCFLFIIPIINIVSCVMDFISYNKLNTLNQPGTFSSMQFAAIMDIVTVITGNPISMIFGIINLIYLNDQKVKAFLIEKGIY
jgi:prepilin signal peptidase PulO-like enzyme (type II secretory pathway)